MLLGLAALGMVAALPVYQGERLDTPELVQTPPVPETLPVIPDLTPVRPLEEPMIPPLPPPGDLIPSLTVPTEEIPEAIPAVPGMVVIERFEVVGSTVFDAADFEAVTAPYTNRPITFTELFAARSAVTELYREAGYATSGAYIPAGQVIDGGVVTIQVIEGTLEGITLNGLDRLNPNYVRSRVAIAAGPPLNLNELLAALQLLQQDPRIERLSAELAAGSAVAASVLNLTVEEADPFWAQVFADNGQSPSIGSFRRGVSLGHLNLTGQGDTLEVVYSNTDGSNTVDLGYRLPFNSRNGTLELFYSRGNSWVIDESFRILDIQTRSQEWSVGLRQPLWQTPTDEIALGLRVTHEVSDRTFQPPGFERIGFPTVGAQDGETRVSAIRFFQEWNQRGRNHAVGVRSQFNLGTDWFGATLNPEPIPDSLFFSWQGQAQWVQRLAPETLLTGRLAGQVADRPLLSLEQFRLGGLGSVRGYRQDQTLGDSGLFASVEARLPLFRIPEWQSTVQLTPFVDYGWAWNRGNRPIREPDHLLSVGAGLLWQVSDRATLRVDWGIPLLEPIPSGDTWQESGILFSITGTL
jgi:hemolysin activation/secretion protein